MKSTISKDNLTMPLMHSCETFMSSNNHWLPPKATARSFSSYPSPPLHYTSNTFPSQTWNISSFTMSQDRVRLLVLSTMCRGIFEQPTFSVSPRHSGITSPGSWTVMSSPIWKKTAGPGLVMTANNPGLQYKPFWSCTWFLLILLVLCTGKGLHLPVHSHR